MSTNSTGEVDLSSEQRETIVASDAETLDVLAELGAAYLEYADVEIRYLRAKTKLVSCKAGAIKAEMKRGTAIATIASTMDLPPGEWTYDPKKGKLVRKDT